MRPDLDDDANGSDAPDGTQPTMEEWLARTQLRTSSIERSEVLAALDELRGPWPERRS